MTKTSGSRSPQTLATVPILESRQKVPTDRAEITSVCKNTFHFQILTATLLCACHKDASQSSQNIPTEAGKQPEGLLEIFLFFLLEIFLAKCPSVDCTHSCIDWLQQLTELHLSKLQCSAMCHRSTAMEH